MLKKYRLFLCILAAVGYCYFVYLFVYRWTYKDLQENKLYDEDALKKESTEAAEPAINMAEGENGHTVVSANTIYILEKYELLSGRYSNEILPVPIEVLGMDKEELYNYYVNYSNILKNNSGDESEVTVSLSEHEIITNIKSMELVNFKNNILVVRMSYEYSEPVYEFVLVEENNKIAVYRISTNEIFANTDIRMQELPYGLRCEVQNGKYFATESEVYYFLESYSS